MKVLLFAAKLGFQATHAAHVLLGPRVLSGPLVSSTSSWNGYLRCLNGLGSPCATRNCPNELPEPVNLIEDHLSHFTHILDDLEVEIEGCRAVGLVTGVVPNGQVGVLKSLLDADASRRVKSEHAVQKVQRIRVRVGEERGERLLGHKWQVSDVLLGSR
jgi:hypothetical protein